VIKVNSMLLVADAVFVFPRFALSIRPRTLLRIPAAFIGWTHVLYDIALKVNL
jgi:hypothetical protein